MSDYDLIVVGITFGRIIGEHLGGARPDAGGGALSGFVGAAEPAAE